MTDWPGGDPLDICSYPHIWEEQDEENHGICHVGGNEY